MNGFQLFLDILFHILRPEVQGKGELLFNHFLSLFHGVQITGGAALGVISGPEINAPDQQKQLPGVAPLEDGVELVGPFFPVGIPGQLLISHAAQNPIDFLGGENRADARKRRGSLRREIDGQIGLIDRVQHIVISVGGFVELHEANVIYPAYSMGVQVHIRSFCNHFMPPFTSCLYWKHLIYNAFYNKMVSKNSILCKRNTAQKSVPLSLVKITVFHRRLCKARRNLV